MTDYRPDPKIVTLGPEFYDPVAAAEHLRCEGVQAEKIVSVGDVMYDVALHHGSRVDASDRVLGRLGIAPGSYALTTVHRAENTDHPQRLAAIVDGLEAVSTHLPVVWPMHPRTRNVLQREGRLARLAPGVRLIDPVGYLDMVQLEKHAAVIATDSGGVQKEAFFYRVPCVTLRDETEWIELIESGWNRLAPPRSRDAVCKAVLSAVGSHGAEVQPYGTGDAARRIAERLRMDLGA